MARFLPPVALDAINYPSEQAVYKALQGLPDGYVVLHSFPWLRPIRSLEGAPLQEGEADFVVLHPQRGLLVLEVKGGQPRLEGRTWVRGRQPMKDPFRQAQRNRYALLDAISERTRGRLTRDLFTHGDVVVFPDCVFAGPLPLHTEERILVDARGLPELPQHIETAFKAWQRAPTALKPAQFNELLEALLPKLQLMRCVGADLEAEGHRIVQVTEDQRTTLRGLLANPRVLVEGTAGSGKTLLALEFATALSVQGSRALLLCYNKQLAAWLNEQVQGEPRLRGVPHELEVGSFHAFALSLARRAGVEFEDPSRATPQFWEEEVPLILEQALDVLGRAGRAPLYDTVIVDEAQDFAPDWWVTIESLTRGGRGGRLYAFLDLHQSLRGEPRLPPVPLPVRFPLTTNCRNTRSIARSAGSLVQAEVQLLPGSPEGEPPGLRRGASAPSAAGLALEEVRRLLRQGLRPAQVVLIGPATHERGSLASAREIDGVLLVQDAAAWRRGDGVLVTTARSFKGLEADVVVLYDLSGFGETFTKADLYVAWTRAKHRLVVVTYGAEARAEVERALATASGSLRQEGRGPQRPS